MRKPMSCSKVSRRFLLLVIGCAGSICTAQAQTSSQYVQPRFDGRAIVATLGVARYAFAQPLVLTLGKDVTGSLQLGFVHSGYTESDPDGRAALLTLTLQVGKESLTPNELQGLKADGIILATTLMPISTPTALKLDVLLPDDPSEEQRIRRTLQLPISISGAFGTRSFQIAWKSVAGKTLFNWLTGNGGLRFSISFDEVVSWKPTTSPILSKQVIDRWWKTRFGDAAEVRITDGITPVALDIVNFGSLAASSETPFSMSGATALIVDYVSKVLSSLGKVDPDKGLVISYAAVTSASWGPTADLQLRLSAMETLRPGTALVDHPELIKDLSGTGAGLDPLRNDHP